MSVAERAPITEAATSRFVQTRRWKLHYHEVGTGDPIIMLHGSGPGATGWSNFHQNLAELSKRHRVLLMDFPGWGRSDPFDCSGESRFGANAEAVALFMDELGIGKSALVGNSMGGITALTLMAASPERVSSCVTMGAGLAQVPDIFSTDTWSPGIRVIFETYQDPSPRNFRRLVEVMVYDSAFATDELAQQRSAAALAAQDHLKNFLKWPFGHPGGPFGGLEALMTGLHKNTTPTLMIHGRNDRTVAMETTLRTAALLPNARAVILNRCGHWAQVEHAAEFNRLVLGFLEQQPA